MQRELMPCPFCGSAPVTYIGFEGRSMGYPVVSANISCEKCKFVLSFQMAYDMVTGMTSFKSMEHGMEYLVGKWNNRVDREGGEES